MIKKTTLDFLRKLKKNNDRKWFEKNRKEYESCREDFIIEVNEIINRIAAFDPGLEGLEAKNTIFRIFRDIRFSKDKTPYKPHFGANMAKGGRKSVNAGYYLHIEPGGKSFLAGGTYRPTSDILASVRNAIDYDPDALKSILNNKTFTKYFGGLTEMEDKLKTAPKGFPKDHPEIELLKHKSFIVFHNLKDDQLASKGFLKDVSNVFKAMAPFNHYLNKIIEG